MDSQTAREMPKFKCHKEVHALKIDRVTLNPNNSVDLFFEDERYSPINLEEPWNDHHEPKVGGYYVVYEDGYASFSPGEAFEKGYALIGES